MNYKIIEPKTVFTVRLESGWLNGKCSGCDMELFSACLDEGCYREFGTEKEAREWLDKVNEIEKSIDDGLLTAAGEKHLNCETCRDGDCLDCPEGD